jgi:hypothetical protein
MGLSDGLFDFLRHRQFAKGAEVLGAAEALEQKGHPGVAARFYDRALEFFQSSAADQTFYQTVSARNRCQQRALHRGEDMSFAYRTSIEDIAKDPPRFMTWYYANQHTTLCNRLSQVFDAQDWAATVRLAEGGRQFLKYADSSAAALAEYDCCYFGGAALFKMGRFSQSVVPMQRAYELARCLNLHDAAKAWTAYFLGLGSCQGGKKTARCEEVLQEAIDRLRNLHDDQFAQPCRQEAANALDAWYSEQLGQDYDIAIAAARRLLTWDGSIQIQSARARAEACVAVDSQLGQASRAIKEKRFDDAAGALRDAQTRAQTIQSPCIRRRLEAIARELCLSDPRNLPEHSRAVAAFLAEDKFQEADRLRGELHARQAHAPGVAQITESITAAKLAYCDRQVASGGQQVEQKNFVEAEQALANAEKIGREVGYHPPAFDSTLAALSQFKAIQMAQEAKTLAEQREFKRARDLIQQAERLPKLPREIAEKLAGLDAAVVRESEDVSTQCCQELQDLMRREEWQRARAALDQAGEKGYDHAVVEERGRVTAYEECRDKLERASQTRNAHKLATARSLLAEVQAATPSPSMKRQAAEAQASLQQLIDTVVRTYVKRDRPEVPLRLMWVGGLMAAGLAWWFSPLGFWASLTLGVGAAVATNGLMMCAVNGSLLAHDDAMHGMTFLGGAGLATFSVCLMHWYWAIGLGMAVGVIIHISLQHICPAVSGVTLEPKEEDKMGDPKDDHQKTNS